MTKRDTPESGFDAALPSKHHKPNHASPSHHDQLVDSVRQHPSPSPNISATPSLTPAPPHPTLNGDSNRRLDEDDFVPGPQLNHASDHDDDFLVNNGRRNEIAREASSLQDTPSPSNQLVSEVVSLIDDVDADSQPDDSPAEHPAPTTTPTASARGHRERFRAKRRKRYHYRPTLWKDGLPDEEAVYIARKADALVCGTTNITLDPEPLLVDGTLWSEVLRDELPDILRSDGPLPLPPQREKFDFLKACFRLGNFIEPHHMSRLLGGGYRSPDYCAFLLQGFMGLLNNYKVRRQLKGGDPPQEKHRDVFVYADHLYPSDDELLFDQQNSSTELEKAPVPGDAPVECALIEESDREEDEDHKDPPHFNRCAVLELGHKLTAEQRFLAKLSYITRNYMSIVTGQEVGDIKDFAAYCMKVGATFLADPRHQPLGRLKWLKDKMPAPEIGKEAAISEPLALWKHAIKTYSVKNLSRCALIRVNPLLDWLCFAAYEADPATGEAEFFRVKRPVVAIAPVALLYLADKAADYALRILSMAIQTEELNPTAEEKDTDHFVIDYDDVTSAAVYLENDLSHRQRSYLSTDMTILGGEHSYCRQWPGLVQRPLTSSEHMELCDRTPKVSFFIPNSITDEMRAVLMSFRQCVRSKLYVNNKLFSNNDPLRYMSATERKASAKERSERNHANGITWSEKGVKEEVEGDEDEDSYDDSPAPFEKQTARRLPLKEHSPREEEIVESVPVDRQVVGGNDVSIPANTDQQRAEKLPKFFDQVNVAELIAFRLGADELKKRRETAVKRSDEEELQLSIPDAVGFLKETADKMLRTTSTVCLHRLGWICLRALGIDIDRGSDDAHPMGYASSANYTNFGQLRSKKAGVLTSRALYVLAQITDAMVRDEAEILMACAAHDDGRPWIDKADVALVASVRKEDFHYRDV